MFLKMQRSVSFIVCFIVLVTLLSLLFSWQNARITESGISSINHSHDVIAQTSHVSAQVVHMESAMRGYVVTGNRIFLEEKEKDRQVVAQQLQTLDTRVKDNPVQQQLVTRLRYLVQQKLLFHDSVQAAMEQSPSIAIDIIKSLRGKQLSDAIGEVTATMQTEEKRLLQVRLSQNRAVTHSRLIVSILVSLLALAALMVAIFRISREIGRRRLAEATARASEMKYKGLIENSAVVIFSADEMGNFTFVSEKCADLTGYTQQELTGSHYSMLLPESWKREVNDFYVRQAQHLIPETQLRFPVITKDGFEKWVEQNTVLLMQEGSPCGYQSIVKDVTETKLGEDLLRAAEAELEEQREENRFRLQAILDNIPMIVYIKDLEGRFVMINKCFKDISRMEDEAVLGKTVYELAAPELAGKYMKADETIKRTLKPVEVEEIMQTEKGERHMLVTKFPLFDKNQRLFAICGVDKDITDMVRNREQLVQAKQRAERAEKLQEEFLANMSHEIRTPMNGIIGMANLLSETKLSEEQKEFLNLIKYSSETLHALINDILDLSRIKAGRMNVEEVDFSIEEVLHGVLVPMKLRAGENGVRLESGFGGVPPFVCGDPHKLSQIISNLVGNAVKFTAKGSITVRAGLQKEDADGVTIEFMVSDTGIGISNEYQESIFDSFVQGGNDMVRRYGGTGLGLAITKRLVELQGGTIHVCSVPGQGSDFHFCITYKHSRQKEAAKKSVTGSHGNQQLQGRRILLVEDNEVNQKVSYHLLHRAGMHVDIAPNGREAICLLESGLRYDLVIMDLQMPVMDGFQATVYLREKLDIQVPVIAMTASALRNERERCFAIGMNAYMTKPFAPADLFKQLHRFLDGVAVPQVAGKTLPGEPCKLYDLENIRELDDPAYTVEVLQLFLDSTTPALEDIRKALVHEKWEQVQHAAHKLKSSMGILQMKTILQVLASIEENARSRRHTGDVSKLLRNVEQQYALVRPMLEAELAEARELVQ